MTRVALALTVIGGCYDPSVALPCTLTCSKEVPCPGDLICDTDARCHAPGVQGCPAPADGSIADGRSFQLSDCPANYNVSIASTALTSRYRLITMGAPYWSQEALCAADLPGATHLLIPENVQEMIELSQYIEPIISGLAWATGVVQSPTAATVSSDWIRFDGVAVDPAIWASGEPDDNDGNEANHSSQIGEIDTRPAFQRMYDQTGDTYPVAICECDGKPISATARMYIENDPNNPN